MADINNTISILFEADDKASDAVKRLGANVSDFGKAADSVTSFLSDMATNLLAIESAVLAVGAAFATKAIGEAMKYESAVADLNKVLDENEQKQFASLDKAGKIDELALKYGMASTEIVTATANFKAAGYTFQESAQLQVDALNLVIAGEMSADEASSLLVASLKGFGASASEATHYVDSFNEVSNKTSASAKELAVGLSQISPIAKQMGFSVDETIGIMTPIIEVFQSGSESATALKTGFLKLLDDSNPVSEALTKIGVSQKDANGNLRQGKDIFYDVAKAFETLDDKQKLFTAAQIVGIDQSAKMVIAFDKLKYIQEVTAISANSAGSAMKEVEVRLQTTELAVQRASVAFDLLAKTAGQQILQNFGGVVKGFTDLELAINQTFKDGSFNEIFDFLREKLDELGKWFSDVAKGLPEAMKGVDFSGLTTAFDKLIGNFKGLFGEMDLTKPQDLQKAIQFLVDSFESLTTVVAGIVKGWEPFVTSIIGTIDSFNDLSPSLKEAAGQGMGFSQVIGTILPSFSALGDGISALGTAMEVFAGVKAAQFVTSITSLGSVTTAFGSTLSTVAPVLGVVGAGLAGFGVGTLVNEYTGASDAIVDFVSKLTGLDEAQNEAIQGQGDLSGAIEKLQQQTGDMSITAENYREKLRGWLEEQKNVSSEQIKSADSFEKMKGLIEKVMSAYDGSDEAKAKLAELKEQWEKMGGVASTFFDENGEGFYEFYEYAADAEDSLAGLEAEYAGLQTKLSGLTEGTKEWTDTQQKISEVDERIEGLIDGITDADIKTGNFSETIEEYLGISQEQFEKLKLYATEHKISLSEAIEKYHEGNVVLGETANKVKAITSNSELDTYKEKVKQLTEKYADQGVELAKLEEKGKKGSAEWKYLKTAMEGTKDAIDKTNNVITALETKQGAAEGKTVKLHKTLTDLSNDEKIRLIEANVQLNVAEIEADVKKTVSAFESINKTMETVSTVAGGALDKLFQGSSWDNDKLFGIIDRQIDIQSNAAEKQNALIDAQIRQMNAKTQALEKGESLITITSEGLEPEIEAFMWKIIQKVQVRVNAEGMDFLMGIPNTETTTA
jgi:TP901 family phage tail tape measure protein